LRDAARIVVVSSKAELPVLSAEISVETGTLDFFITLCSTLIYTAVFNVSFYLFLIHLLPFVAV